jgi:hypothetical protein
MAFTWESMVRIFGELMDPAGDNPSSGSQISFHLGGTTAFFQY